MKKLQNTESAQLWLYLCFYFLMSQSLQNASTDLVNP